MDVDFGNLALAQQVLERQEGHARAISEHLEQYGRLSSGEMGLILQLVKPINDAILDAGHRALRMSAQVYGTSAEMMARTRETYVEADRAAHTAVVRAGSAFGIDGSSYVAPTAPTLGAAKDGAPPQYGQADGNLFQQAFQDGYDAVDWAARSAEQIERRFNDGTSSDRTVAEQVDCRSFLVAPHAEDPEIESVRWKAGIILGSVDWMFEELFGYSLLEEITKPFSGNWVRMREASFAWSHAGDAISGLASNTTALLPPMASWTGRGSEAFLGATALVGQAHSMASAAPGTVASLLKALTFLAKEVAKQILKILNQISNRLLRMIVEASAPIAGWIVAGAEAVIAAQEIVDDVLTAYKWVNIIYDFVSGMVQGVSTIVDSTVRLVDLAEGLGRGAMARA